MQIQKVTVAGNKNQAQIKNLSDKLTFTGCKVYPSGVYEDYEIETAKRFKNHYGAGWKENLFNERWSQNLKCWDTFAQNTYFDDGFIADGKGITRVLLDVLTLGILEVENLVEKGIKAITVDKTSARKYVERIARLIPDLVAEDVEKGEIAAIKKHRQGRKIAAYEGEKEKIKDKLTREFVDLVDMDLKGKKVEMPNCIMLVGQSDDMPKELIDWTGKEAECNYVKLAHEDKDVLQDVLSEALEKAEEEFKATKKRTLIYVEGFDRLINPEINEFENIAGLKGIMDRCATECGATIIFSTKDTSKLAVEAIQPHRVTAMIDVRIKSPEEMAKEAPAKLAKNIEIIKNRRNSSRAEAKPLNFLNDFIKLSASDERKTLKPGASYKELKWVECSVSNITSKCHDPELLMKAVRKLR